MGGVTLLFSHWSILNLNYHTVTCKALYLTSSLHHFGREHNYAIICLVKVSTNQARSLRLVYSLGVHGDSLKSDKI